MITVFGFFFYKPQKTHLPALHDSLLASLSQVGQLTEVFVCVFVCVSRCPVDVHRTEPPLQTGAEVIMAAPAAQMEQRGRLPLGGR